MVESRDPESGLIKLDPRKLELVQLVQRMRTETGLPVRKLADEPNRQGIPSVLGASWHPTSVQKALQFT
jgi:hypothetical protein